MAIARLSVKVGKLGKALPHASYIARQGVYAKRLDSGEKLEATGAGNMPEWSAHNPLMFWQQADQNERKNGATYREHELALPRELNPAQRLDLLQDWVQQEIGDKYAYQYAIHNAESVDGGENPHVHLMFSERRLDGIDRDPQQFFKRYNSKHPDRGGCKKDNTGIKPAERREQLKQQRERWEKLTNDHLERAGSSARIDMRSYKEQGLDLEPEPKMLPSEWRDPAKRAELIDFREAKKELLEARRKLNTLVPEMRKALREGGKKSSGRATPEMAKREYEKELNAVAQAIENMHQQQKEKKEATQQAFSDHCKNKPEQPTGMFAGISGKNRQYEKDMKAWEDEEKKLRYAKIDAERYQPVPSAVYQAKENLKAKKPELYKLLMKVEQQEKEDSQNKKQPDREKRLEKMRSRMRSRSRGRGR